MLDQHLYVREKLEESRREAYSDAQLTLVELERPNPKQRQPRRRLAPIFRIAGSSLRRAGETLESWAAHPRAEDVAR